MMPWRAGERVGVTRAPAEHFVDRRNHEPGGAPRIIVAAAAKARIVANEAPAGFADAAEFAEIGFWMNPQKVGVLRHRRTMTIELCREAGDVHQ